MSRNQRVAMLAIAAIIAVAAIVVLGQGDDEPPATEPAAQTEEPAGTPAGSEATEPEATSTPKPDRKRPAVPVLTGESVREIEVDKGDTVSLAARAPSDDEIHVHGYDLMKEAPAGRTVRMSFEATLEGIWGIEFERSGVPIAELRVNP